MSRRAAPKAHNTAAHNALGSPVTRIALVTGANKGIGRDVARQLCERGYTILVAARDAARGGEAAEQLRAAGGKAHFLALDVTDAASIARAVETIRRDHGVLDVLVNNAAIKLEFHPAPPSECTLDIVRQTRVANRWNAALLS